MDMDVGSSRVNSCWMVAGRTRRKPNRATQRISQITEGADDLNIDSDDSPSTDDNA